MFYHGMNFSNQLCGPGSFFPGPFGIIINLLFWALIIVVIVKGVSYLFGRSAKSDTASPGALDILKERYARGEISKTDYEEIKKDLG